MEHQKSNPHNISRRNFLGTTSAGVLALSLTPLGFACSTGSKPDSNFGGVQIGAITYSWRSMPSTAEDIIKYCVEQGLAQLN